MLKSNLIPILAVVAFGGILATLKNWTPFQSQTELKHFDGVVDNSHQTHDPVRSRLAVDAVKALERGDAKSAEKLYRTMVSKYPADATVYVNLAVCLGYQKRFEESSAQYKRALGLDPRSAGAYQGLGSNAYELGNDTDAIKLLTKALELEEDGLSHWTLALAYDRDGDATNAIRHYEKAIQSRQIDSSDVSHASERLRDLKKYGDRIFAPDHG